MKNTKPQPRTRELTIAIRRSTYAIYRKADKELARRTGIAPGAEAIMAVKLELETDAEFLADLYCLIALKQSPRRIARYRRKSRGTSGV